LYSDLDKANKEQHQEFENQPTSACQNKISLMYGWELGTSPTKQPRTIIQEGRSRKGGISYGLQGNAQLECWHSGKVSDRKQMASLTSSKEKLRGKSMECKKVNVVILGGCASV